MLNTNKNILLTATILAFCIILFVHVFLFPVYDVNRQHSTRLYSDLERSLCDGNLPNEQHVWSFSQCPRDGIVTIIQGGRLGNQMWEYASVWGVARRTGLQPYVPHCIRVRLDQVFERMSIPTFSEIAHCNIDGRGFVRSLDAWNYTYESIILPRYSVLPDLVFTWVQDIIQEFTFKSSLLNKSRAYLHGIGKKENVFVGVHVRRTDYIPYIWSKYGIEPAGVDFFQKAMKYYQDKFQNVVFVMVSDDPKWCMKHFGNRTDVHITSKKTLNPPALDLAILASCNHSIFDYGTYGAWGAILAGGETIFYRTKNYSNYKHILPNWKAIDM